VPEADNLHPKDTDRPVWRLRILVLTPMYPAGGEDMEGLFVREQAEALAAEGADVLVAHVRNRLAWPFSCLKPQRPPSGDRAGGPVPVYRHEVRGWPAALGLNRYARRLSLELAARLEQEWSDFRPDLIYAHTIIPGALIARSVAAHFACPVVATSHGADTRVWLRKRAGRQAILAAGQRGMPVICVSESIRGDLADAGYPKPLLHVVHNGMDLAKVHSGENPLTDRYAGKPVILGIGNLKPTKGFDIFIEALAQARQTHPAIHGIIVGDGSERRQLERLAEKRGISDVLELVGAKSPAETMRYMDACTVFCLPSWSEGFGIVYLEAMAHGKPVIAVEGQGIASIVGGARSGLVVPPRDAVATAAALRDLLDHPDESLAMGSRGRQTVMQAFTWTHNASRMMDLFRNVMKASREETAARGLAHVNFTVDRSVELKLERMAAAARALHLPMDFLVYSAAGEPVRRENFILRRLPGGRLFGRLAARFQWPFRLIWAARDLGPARYGAVILRYPKLPFGWRTFLHRAGVPVITEHHTDEVAEIRGSSGWVRRAAAAVERHLRAGFLRRISGVIGVTPEITARIRAEAPQATARTITNGVDVASVPATGFVPFDGAVLRMVSVASEFVPWQGLDRLLNGMLNYRGPVLMDLVLVGSVPAALAGLIQRCTERPGITIQCPGLVFGPELDTLLAHANLAIASLGLFRKQMSQACPLKVREYTARGIPFVYGYEDPDLPEDVGFAMRVPNDERPVDMEAVICFAARTAGETDLSGRMRAFAGRQMDWSGKVRILQDAARRAVGNEKGHKQEPGASGLPPAAAPRTR
jgi:glycosyltransferase involved in cell wall biosynthesis